MIDYIKRRIPALGLMFKNPIILGSSVVFLYFFKEAMEKYFFDNETLENSANWLFVSISELPERPLALWGLFFSAAYLLKCGVDNIMENIELENFKYIDNNSQIVAQIVDKFDHKFQILSLVPEISKSNALISSSIIARNEAILLKDFLQDIVPNLKRQTNEMNDEFWSDIPSRASDINLRLASALRDRPLCEFQFDCSFRQLPAPVRSTKFDSSPEGYLYDSKENEEFEILVEKNKSTIYSIIQSLDQIIINEKRDSEQNLMKIRDIEQRIL